MNTLETPNRIRSHCDIFIEVVALVNERIGFFGL